MNPSSVVQRCAHPNTPSNITGTAYTDRCTILRAVTSEIPLRPSRPLRVRPLARGGELSCELVQLDVEGIVIRDASAQRGGHLHVRSSVRVDGVAQLPPEALHELDAEVLEAFRQTKDVN